ncbi:replication-relaxation family protein [Streptomyces sp. NPDC059340]|uniref:replication-relaxation family protein n=1 Tax=Streptomyces sp. NPDC059340 TaxID=3346806 RepID=UPI00369723DE
MIGVDVGSGDRLALGVLTQYRMATTEQMHRVIAPSVRIEQTRRRLARLRSAGLIDRITLPQAGRTRVWFPTPYGVQLAAEWPEMRGHRPSRTMSDPTPVRLKAGHALTVTETALAFLEDARRRGEQCRPLDWIPEVHHSIGNGEAVIPDALLYYKRRPADGDSGAMLRAFVEVDRATMGPESAPLPLRTRSPRAQASPQGASAGGVAALPALPPRPVRPGRHRPHRRREPDHRPARGGRAAGAVALPARRPHPRGAAGRPAPPQPLRTRMAPGPRP